MATNPESSPYAWNPPEGYYEDIARSEVNAPLHWLGRGFVETAVAVRFGLPRVIVSPGFAATDLTEGNVMVAATHRHDFDTVALPCVLELVGIHHSRPVSKIELFQNRFARWLLHQEGAFAVDRKHPNTAGLTIAQQGIMSRGGNITTYGEGTRVTTDVLKVAEVKPGLVVAAAINDSTVVPVGAAGFSTEKVGEKPHQRKVARDRRSWFGIGPRLVFAFGDPTKVIIPYPRIDPRQLTRAERSDRSQAIRSETERIRTAMQDQLDVAYEIRGSSLEKIYDQAA